MADILIQGGTVIDGTGAERFAADVRVSGGRIAEVGPNLKAKPGEEVFDATGCFVTPGFIEGHTHYDATMWWQPDLDPLPGVGATTVITGNCGFTAAPLSDDKAAQLEMVKIFSFFEDIPLEPFLKNVPWDWRKWSEYKKSVKEKVHLPLNNAAFVGHIAIRLAAMGLEAWKRPATAEERKVMADMLDEALSAGALGLSTNLLDHDGEDRPIPTLVADDAEFSTLFDVLEKHPHTVFQCIIDVALMRDTGPAQTDRMARLLKGRKIRTQLTGAIPTVAYQNYLLQPMVEKVEAMRAEGMDIWPGYAHVPLTGQLSIYKSLIFAQSNDYVWHEVVLEEDLEKKAQMLADPEWRARARASWDGEVPKHSPQNNPSMLLLTKLGSDNGAGPFCTLAEYAEQLGVHRSDAMAEWLLRNGVMSTVRMAPFDMDEKVVVDMIKDSRTLGNITDAGAHLQMLCGGGENLIYLIKYVREQKAISLEQAIHTMSGKIAEHFFLTDIGEIKAGKRADIVVFDLDEIQQHDMEKVYDVTDGKGGITWRYTRKAAPMKLTLVNGEATFRDGAYTGAKPGDFLEPAQADAAMAVAAE
ncbi:N-acyl-D-amino-acid deacylase family protein [Flavisphingomonas formosensis]|uniref:N-acyl-D-amino-acid deacylase family protein n=1 Tax=Flavisphingomonas formosensis TaxID=861534 RepID=UPI0012F85E71|nr:amidohydrolase family protein [Sphingomonas formosensis]